MNQFSNGMTKDKDTLTIDQLRNVAQKTMPIGSHVWLYGSRARNNARDDSDWDLLVLLDKQQIASDDYELFCFPFVHLGWQNFADVSPQLYTIEEWEQRRLTPFYQNVEHEKQVIYGA